jgi:hypothetical protein
VRASEEEIAQSLTGTWRTEHVFCLAQALALYDAYCQLIVQADEQLEAMISPLRQHADTLVPNKDKGHAKNAPRFDVRKALYQWSGVDLTPYRRH